MSLVLDSIMQIGDAYVAPLVHSKSSGRAFGPLVAITAVKRAEAVLIFQDGQTRAYDISGQPLALSKIEQLCSGAIEQFERYVSAPDHS